MDIRVGDYVQAGTRVLSTECTLCQTCITACPQRTLRLSAGLDVGGQERLRRLGEGTAVTLREPAPEARAYSLVSTRSAVRSRAREPRAR